MQAAGELTARQIRQLGGAAEMAVAMFEPRQQAQKYMDLYAAVCEENSGS